MKSISDNDINYQAFTNKKMGSYKDLKKNRGQKIKDFFYELIKKIFGNGYSQLIDEYEEDELEFGRTYLYKDIKIYVSPENIVVGELANVFKSLHPDQYKNIVMGFNEQNQELEFSYINSEKEVDFELPIAVSDNLNSLYENHYNQLAEQTLDPIKLQESVDKSQRQLALEFERDYNVRIIDNGKICAFDSQSYSNSGDSRVVLAGETTDEKLDTARKILDKTAPLATSPVQRLMLEDMFNQTGVSTMNIALLKDYIPVMNVSTNLLESDRKILADIAADETNPEPNIGRYTAIYPIAQNCFFIDVATKYIGILPTENLDNFSQDGQHCIMEDRAQFLLTEDNFHVIGSQRKII